MSVTPTVTRPCRGPHHCTRHRTTADPSCDDCPPITSAPVCDKCRRELVRILNRLPDAYVDAYLALEPGQRFDVRSEQTHGRRGKAADAPLPLDVEADALMRRILEVVLSWHEAVIAAAGLSQFSYSLPPLARSHRFTKAARGEHGETVKVPLEFHVRVVERQADDQSGVAITTACRTLSAHVDTLLHLPSTPMTRTVSRRRVLGLADETTGVVMADGRAVVIQDLDGVDAALELFRLQRDIRRTLGLSRGATVFDRPCPGCDEPGLVLLQGADEVVCSSCGERWGASDWRRLEEVLKSSPATGEAS